MERGVSGLFSTIFGGILGIVTWVGIVANIFVLVAILGDRKMRNSAMNLLLMNLAVADLLYLITFTSTWVSVVIYGLHVWFLPWYLCPIIRWLTNVLLDGSVGTYTAICLERYVAIVKPMKAKEVCTKRNMLLAILVIWTVSLIFESPNIFQYKYIPYWVVGANDSPLIELDRKMSFALAILHRFEGIDLPWDVSIFKDGSAGKPNLNSIIFFSIFNSVRLFSVCSYPTGPGKMMWYRYAELIFTYVIPIILSAIIYFRICRTLWSTSTFLHKGTDKTSGLKNSGDAMAVALRARKSVVKMLITCVAVFFICYTPMMAMFLLVAIWNWRMLLSFESVLALQTLVMFVSAFNPFLYTLFSNAFRQRVRDLVPWVFTISIRENIRKITRSTILYPVSSDREKGSSKSSKTSGASSVGPKNSVSPIPIP
ncbi:7 transmembrane receptor (rhodopsin family) domain-containing protein [Ditylenchus destructor]|uniref:7 transmembrane receptor (Rhodopsin family) domain-containing protein n=1 Tax=Ditylenchus destructor TaxID=166010 RepID=A0AAD4MHZ2_9BILA|nr:7 transmembrane receptor (rhodopsin family) domain-containing protein [Ditylenchus destructor]